MVYLQHKFRQPSGSGHFSALVAVDREVWGCCGEGGCLEAEAVRREGGHRRRRQLRSRRSRGSRLPSGMSRRLPSGIGGKSQAKEPVTRGCRGAAALPPSRQAGHAVRGAASRLPTLARLAARDERGGCLHPLLPPILTTQRLSSPRSIRVILVARASAIRAAGAPPSAASELDAERRRRQARSATP